MVNEVEAMEKFNNMFREKQGLIRNISTRYSRASGIPIEEFISRLNEAFWRAYQEFEEDRGANFDTFLKLKFRNTAINLMKNRHGNYYRKVQFFSVAPKTDEEYEVDESQLIEAEVNIEDEVTKRIDQRQLVDSLVRSAKTDATTTTIVEAVLSAPPSASDLAIAKSLGLHHEIFKRKLRKLSRQFDANRFGEARDYLAV